MAGACVIDLSLLLYGLLWGDLFYLNRDVTTGTVFHPGIAALPVGVGHDRCGRRRPRGPLSGLPTGGVTMTGIGSGDEVTYSPTYIVPIRTWPYRYLP